MISCTSAVLLGWRLVQREDQSRLGLGQAHDLLPISRGCNNIPTALFAGGQKEQGGGLVLSMVRAAKVWLQMTADGSLPRAAKAYPCLHCIATDSVRSFVAPMPTKIYP